MEFKNYIMILCICLAQKKVGKKMIQFDYSQHVFDTFLARLGTTRLNPIIARCKRAFACEPLRIFVANSIGPLDF